MKKLISLFMSFVMLLSITAGLNLSVSAETSGDYEYIILGDGTAEIKGYSGSADNLAIPSIIDEYTVTSIGNGAFANCSKLTNITIPNSVTSIGESAFGACLSLANITIPNSVTSIGESAFCYCDNLTSITIPSSVTSIGQKAFLYCAGLTAINVDSGNTVYSSDNGVLFNKDKSKLIQCPVGSSITSFDVPNSVTTICNNAFNRCEGLLSITIPNSVISIGDEAFFQCSSIKSVTIPSSVTCIGDEVFFLCSSLKRIVIPESVGSIGKSAFYFCSSLSDVFFTGSEEQWNAVSIETGNDNLSNANIHFNFKPCEEHTFAIDKAVPASCKDTGLTEGSHCSVCGEILVEQTVAPKLPHEKLIENRKNYVAPTCTKGGGYDV